jgi:hypothetical protein
VDVFDRWKAFLVEDEQTARFIFASEPYLDVRDISLRPSWPATTVPLYVCLIFSIRTSSKFFAAGAPPALGTLRCPNVSKLSRLSSEDLC